MPQKIKPCLEVLERRNLLSGNPSAAFVSALGPQFVPTGVVFLYQEGLGRTPGPIEINYWNATYPSLKEQAILIFGSPEFNLVNRTAADQFFKDYAVLAHRLPDAPGWLYWTGNVLPANYAQLMAPVAPSLVPQPTTVSHLSPENPGNFQSSPPGAPPAAQNLMRIGTTATPLGMGTPILVVEGFDPGSTENGTATWQLTIAGMTFTADDLTRRSDKSFYDANLALAGYQGTTYQEVQLS